MEDQAEASMASPRIESPRVGEHEEQEPTPGKREAPVEEQEDDEPSSSTGVANTQQR
jgi:hypothetical protein